MEWTLDGLRVAVEKPLGDFHATRPAIVVHGLRDNGVHLVVELDVGR